MIINMVIVVILIMVIIIVITVVIIIITVWLGSERCGFVSPMPLRRHAALRPCPRQSPMGCPSGRPRRRWSPLRARQRRSC